MLQSALSIIPLHDSKIWRQQESKDEMWNVYTVSGTFSNKRTFYERRTLFAL